MHKLITLTDEQYEKIQTIMKDRRVNSFSELVRYLVLFYEDNQKRPVGRPKSQEDDAGRSDDDDVEKYKVPDKHTTSPYSYNDLVSWYSAHPDAGPMPDRKDLELHKDYKGR